MAYLLPHSPVGEEPPAAGILLPDFHLVEKMSGNLLQQAIASR